MWIERCMQKKHNFSINELELHFFGISKHLRCLVVGANHATTLKQGQLCPCQYDVVIILTNYYVSRMKNLPDIEKKS